MKPVLEIKDFQFLLVETRAYLYKKVYEIREEFYNIHYL